MVRRQKKLKSLSIGQNLEAKPEADTAPTGASLASGATSPLQSPARPTNLKEDDMEFFRIRKDIPFMKYALIFNVISI